MFPHEFSHPLFWNSCFHMFVPLTPPSVIWLPSCEGVMSCLTGSVRSVVIAECLALNGRIVDEQ